MEENQPIQETGNVEKQPVQEVENIENQFAQDSVNEQTILENEVKNDSDSELPPAPVKKKKWWILAVVAVGIALICSALFFTYHYFTREKSELDESLIPVMNGNRWGFVDHQGTFVINPQFLDAEYFKNGVARVMTAEGYVGYINQKGEFVVPSKYLNGTSFSHDRAFVVEEGGHPTCIDRTGKTVFVLEEAQGAGMFSEGLALYYVQKNERDISCGFVNEDGKVVIQPQFYFADNFHEGLAAVFDGKTFGYINKKGETVIAAKYEMASQFSEGLAAVYDGKMWGYIEPNGEYAIPAQFEDVGLFHNGLAAVQKDNQWHFINPKGEFVGNGYDEVGDFTDDLAAVRVGNKYGYINRKGEQIIAPQFDGAASFFSGVGLIKDGALCGFVNEKGQISVKAQFDDIYTPDYTASSIVESDFYDASIFLDKLCANFSTQVADGFKAHPTIQDLMQHAAYKDGFKQAVTMYKADFLSPIAFDDEIMCDRVTFMFDGKAYEYEDDRLADEFCVQTPVKSADYHFVMRGLAQQRTSSVAGLLAQKLATVYKLKVINHPEVRLLGDGSFLKVLEGKDFSFLIIGGKGDLTLTVFYDANHCKQAVTQLTNGINQILNADMGDPTADYVEQEPDEQGVGEDIVD